MFNLLFICIGVICTIPTDRTIFYVFLTKSCFIQILGPVLKMLCLCGTEHSHRLRSFNPFIVVYLHCSL